MEKASSDPKRKRIFGCLCGVLLSAGLPRPASAQTGSVPPPTSLDYLQYGVSLHTVTLLDGGSTCPAGARTPCIVGSGGGLGLRMGYRARGPFYLGASFQLSRLNSSNLLRLPILQRLTADGRYYFDRGSRVTPYFEASLGGAIYGNEWRAGSGGIAFGLGVGVEYQVTATTVIALVPTYQPVAFRRWRDSTGQDRASGPLGFGAAHWLAVQVVIEARDPLLRW